MYLEIYSNGVKLPSPSDVTPTEEIVWSSNTGRSTTGEMIGDTIAEKQTVEITWTNITGTQLQQIKDALPTIDHPFRQFDLKDSSGNTVISFNGYRSGINKKLLKIMDGSNVIYSSVIVSIIEK